MPIADHCPSAGCAFNRTDRATDPEFRDAITRACARARTEWRED
jgi:hypothetical protein